MQWCSKWCSEVTRVLISHRRYFFAPALKISGFLFPSLVASQSLVSLRSVRSCIQWHNNLATTNTKDKHIFSICNVTQSEECHRSPWDLMQTSSTAILQKILFKHWKTSSITELTIHFSTNTSYLPLPTSLSTMPLLRPLLPIQLLCLDFPSWFYHSFSLQWPAQHLITVELKMMYPLTSFSSTVSQFWSIRR